MRPVGLRLPLFVGLRFERQHVGIDQLVAPETAGSWPDGTVCTHDPEQRFVIRIATDLRSHLDTRDQILMDESRSLSPALIAEYQTQLPDKKMLRAKLHEFYLQNNRDDV